MNMIRTFLLLIAAVMVSTGCVTHEEMMRRNIDTSNRVHQVAIDSAVNTIGCPQLSTETEKESIKIGAKATSSYKYDDRRNRYGTYERYGYKSNATVRISATCKRIR